MLKLTASSAAASTATSMLPGDWASPIATELAQMSKYFVIVLCAVYLEKFILAVSNLIAFKWLIPIACGVYVLGVITGQRFIKSMSVRAAILGLSLFMVVPVSLEITKLVEAQYEESINQVIDSAEASSSYIQESVGSERNNKDGGNGLSGVIQNLKNTGDAIANGSTQLIEYFRKLLSRFIESAAIMIVISCVIPILVMLFFVWLLRALFDINLDPGYRSLENFLERHSDVNAGGGRGGSGHRVLNRRGHKALTDGAYNAGAPSHDGGGSDDPD